MIRSIDRKTGQVKWEYDIRRDGDQRQFHGDPLNTDELVVIGTDGNMGHVYAFESSTGAVRWKYRVGERGVSTDIIRLEGNVYAVTLGDELVSLDLKSGKPNWTFRAGYSGQDCLTCSSPAASEGYVYFGGLDGFAYALNAQTGKLKWKRDLGAKITTSAAVRGHNLYLGTAKRHLYRLDIDSGEVLSDFATDAPPNGHLTVADGSLLVFLGDEILANFDLDLNKQRWSVEASKEWTSARPYLWQGNVLAGNRRELVAFSSTDGTRVWSHEFPETIRGIGTSEEALYVGSLKGPILAYSPKP